MSHISCLLTRLMTPVARLLSYITSHVLRLLSYNSCLSSSPFSNLPSLVSCLKLLSCLMSSVEEPVRFWPAAGFFVTSSNSSSGSSSLKQKAFNSTIINQFLTLTLLNRKIPFFISIFFLEHRKRIGFRIFSFSSQLDPELGVVPPNRLQLKMFQLLSPVSCLLFHVSCLLSHVSCLDWRLLSPVLSHVSCLLSLFHVSCLSSLFHVSCLRSHVFCLSFPD